MAVQMSTSQSRSGSNKEQRSQSNNFQSAPVTIMERQSQGEMFVQETGLLSVFQSKLELYLVLLINESRPHTLNETVRLL